MTSFELVVICPEHSSELFVSDTTAILSRKGCILYNVANHMLGIKSLQIGSSAGTGSMPCSDLGCAQPTSSQRRFRSPAAVRAVPKAAYPKRGQQQLELLRNLTQVTIYFRNHIILLALYICIHTYSGKLVEFQLSKMITRALKGSKYISVPNLGRLT